MKNSRIRNGNIVLHGELQGPAVATGTTVTSAKRLPEPAAEGILPSIPETQKCTTKLALDIQRGSNQFYQS